MAFSPLWRSRLAWGLAFGLATTTTLPLLTAMPGQAQFRTPRTTQDGGLLDQRLDNAPDEPLDRQLGTRLPRGTVLPTRYAAAERIIVKPDETNEVELVVVEDVRSSARGRVVIPAGSVVAGEIRPDGDGVRFIAETVAIRGDRIDAEAERENDDREDEDEREDDRDAEDDRDDDYEWSEQDIDAISQRLIDRETITEESDPDILRGAAIGGVAAVILSEILGEIDVFEVLGGAGLGVLAEILISDDNTEEVEVIIIEDSDDLDLTLQAEFVRVDR